MKKLLFSLTALLALASCAKEQSETPIPTEKDGNAVTLSFVAESNTSQTKAFFDATATTEV